MPYEKQYFKDYETILTAKHMDHIEDGIARIYDDLYDIKTSTEYISIYKTDNIQKPDYAYQYASSVFSGWWGCIGKPRSFDQVRFPLVVREGHPLTSVEVRILEIPSKEEVTFNTTSTNNAITPAPNKWKIIASATVAFEESPAPGTNHIVTVNFSNPIVNTEGKYLYMGVLCSDLITMGFIETTYEDIEYNPWIFYATNGNTNCNGVSGGYKYNPDSKTIYALAAEFFLKESETTKTVIGTSKKDKFFKLVNECLNNSDSFGEIFQESYKYGYLCGSANLTNSKVKSYGNTSSTFTGVVFPIGVVPANIETHGVLLQIKTRSEKGSTKPISRVNAYLYAVDDVPLTENYKGKDFSALNPQLLRSGVASCNLAVNEEDVLFVPWTEGSFSNIAGKFLMLGYECNSFNYRCLTGKSGASVCGAIDGHSYGSLETWYSTSQEGTQYWRPRWQDTSANAWSFVTSEKYYDLGEKFYVLLEEALQKELGDVQLSPTSEVCLAKEYDLVVGDKFQLFYEGVIKGFDVLNEGIYIKCPVGSQYPRYWEFTPLEEHAGKSYTLTLKTRQLDGSVISEGKTTLKVHAKLTNETTPKKLTALIFGDSLTSSGAWAAEGFRRIYGTDTTVQPASLGVTNSIVTYGSKNNLHNNFRIYHEGYGGWQWSSFLNPERGSDSTINGIIVTLETEHNYDLNTVQKSIWTDNNDLLWELEDFPSDIQIKFNRGNGNNATQAETTTPITLTSAALGLSITPTKIVWETTNPFYDEATESLDFIAHANKYGAETADIVSCLLTWNGASGINATFEQTSIIERHMGYARSLLLEIHKDFPKAKIICMGLQLSSITGGCGKNYGANGGYADTWASAFYAFDYNKALEKLVTTDPELSSYCYYVDTKGQFDTRYSMPYETVPINTRLSTVTEMRGSNGVHPSTAGYYQIGDAFYRVLHKVIPLVAAEQ